MPGEARTVARPAGLPGAYGSIPPRRPAAAPAAEVPPAPPPAPAPEPETPVESEPTEQSVEEPALEPAEGVEPGLPDAGEDAVDGAAHEETSGDDQELTAPAAEDAEATETVPAEPEEGTDL